MGIFRFEMKQYKGSVIAWSIGISAAILALLSVSAAFTKDPSSIALLEGNDFLEAMGVNPETFFTGMGIYGVYGSFALLAGAIQAINLGLSIITKEHMQNTADFLMTKPYTRKRVYLSKLAAACCCLLITAICYFAASLWAVSAISGQSFSFTIFFQLYLLFPLLQLFFLLLGMAIGVLLSRIGSTLPLALGISFGFYLIGMYSSVVQSQVARLFSPFKYFNVNIIQASGGYETGYLILYLALLTTFLISGYTIFVRKDMKMVL
ncbi:MAG: ABC transporter permease subunit [Alistipes sp.]|nr:ABC transporter permease subunit [Alistipes sp.]